MLRWVSTGEMREAWHACALGWCSSVFLLGCMGHWNGDRDCEPAQLTGRLLGGQASSWARNPASVVNPFRGGVLIWHMARRCAEREPLFVWRGLSKVCHADCKERPNRGERHADCKERPNRGERHRDCKSQKNYLNCFPPWQRPTFGGSFEGGAGAYTIAAWFVCS